MNRLAVPWLVCCLSARKSWTWAACTVPPWPSSWGASGRRWRVWSPGFLPERSAPCLWVWPTGGKLSHIPIDTFKKEVSCRWLVAWLTDFEETNQRSSLPLRQRAGESHARDDVFRFLMLKFFTLCFYFSVLAFSLSRYKLKFSPDKVDTMIVQAICECIFVYLFIFWIFCSESCFYRSVKDKRWWFWPRVKTLRPMKVSKSLPHLSLCAIGNMDVTRVSIGSLPHWNSFSFLCSQLFWMTWTRSWITTSCDAASGTAGTSPNSARSSRTTWPTARPSVRSVRAHAPERVLYKSFWCTLVVRVNRWRLYTDWSRMSRVIELNWERTAVDFL